MNRATGFDYDTNPARFRAAREATARFAEGDVHEDVATRIVRERLTPVLDVGSGTGTLGPLLEEASVDVVSLDLSTAFLAEIEGPRVRASAEHLPFADRSFGAVAALWMLYHLTEPARAVVEAHRILRPGGLFAACTASRYNDPELEDVLTDWGTPSAFDAENAENIVGVAFDEIEMERWDEKLVHLPDTEAITLYLRGRGLDAPEAVAHAQRIPKPLDLTKRGVLIWARKPAP